ncbi:MAG: tRNA (adenosine(37)-N6)-threonylcarbamoyltransferase complex ATPase subunit type 1 TsaE [Oscillospiraceae bacterium]|nr:tRNA (adenosine(37)-N6)-threonylcarbamoyltransferase complex ATPase subunit type 1 TsaE [Oscillospiraceae bacterium]
MLIYETNSAEETIELAAQIGAKLKGGEVIAYKGGLGAGKTTFTRGLAVGMGLKNDVSSPTFAIVNEYRGSGRLSLCHFDMYRITNSAALETTGFYDYMSEDTVIAVEWSENIAEELEGEKNVITITISGSGDRRIITVEAESGDDIFADIGDRYLR